MRFRQIHLDFHTSERIPGVGSAFAATQFQDMLKLGHVDSITVFSKCHHGWSYHPTAVGRRHPALGFDLLRAQLDAAHAIGVRTPVYLSAGLDEQSYWRHPEWARREVDGKVPWAGTNDRAGFHELCMNTGYLDLLAAEVEEVCRTYAADGIFLDIVSPRPCWCNACVQERIAEVRAAGLAEERFRDPGLIARQARRTYFKYTRAMRAAADRGRPGMALFHNGGHIPKGDHELARENSHLELESLPTGGWGYDHFPISAGYARTLGMPFLGMSGKFHLSWGEFGGFKHPNALRYEAAAAAAVGARFSIGDQLHPDGRMEPATYAIVGAAYAELEAKEPWLVGARSLAEIALLSHEAVAQVARRTGNMPLNNAHDEGAARMLLEGGHWFDVLDAEADFKPYTVIILPDAIRLDVGLAARLRDFIAGGGKVIATGESGLAVDRDEQLLDLGASDAGTGAFDPDYIVPRFATAWRQAAFVVYGAGRVLQAAGGEVLAHRDPPYFNRDLPHFCSHAHTPNSRGDGGPAIVRGPGGCWLAHPLFRIYAEKGQQVVRDVVLHCIGLEAAGRQVETSLPSAGRVTLFRQDQAKRDVLHLLFATPSKRGTGVEVIEDLIPLRDVSVAVRRTARPATVRLVPAGTPLPFTYDGGRVRFTVPTLECHQMVELAD
jgi:hypothetical protein